MKSILAIVVMSFSLQAWAMPEVGDFSQLEGLHGADQIMMQRQLMSFRAGSDDFLELTIVHANGAETERKEQWMKRDDMMSDQKVEQIMAYCAMAGGKLESVTVIAGTFDTCGIPVDNDNTKGTAWIGRVPFGLVKWIGQNKADGIETDVQLSKFAFGQ